MFRSMCRLAALPAVALCCATLPCPAAGEPAANEARILEALDQDTVMDFIDTPLRDVTDYLRDMHEIPIVIDLKALEEIGLAVEAPVTTNLQGITLRSALHIILRQIDLAYVVRDEVLVITSAEQAEASRVTKVYVVSDLLLASEQGAGQFSRSGDTLIEVVTSSVRPESWQGVGGPGSIVGASFGGEDLLVVSQTMEVHEDVERLLGELRDATAQAKALRRAETPQGSRGADRPHVQPAAGDRPADRRRRGDSGGSSEEPSKGGDKSAERAASGLGRPAAGPRIARRQSVWR